MKSWVTRSLAVLLLVVALGTPAQSRAWEGCEELGPGWYHHPGLLRACIGLELWFECMLQDCVMDGEPWPW